MAIRCFCPPESSRATLKYHADFLSGFLPWDVASELACAFHADTAALDGFQPVYAAQKGGFAAAGCAEDDDGFAFFQVQTEIGDGCGVAVFFVQVSDAD